MDLTLLAPRYQNFLVSNLVRDRYRKTPFCVPWNQGQEKRYLGISTKFRCVSLILRLSGQLRLPACF